MELVVDTEHIAVVVGMVVASSFEVVDFAIEAACDRLVEDDDTFVVAVHRNYCTSSVVAVVIFAFVVVDWKRDFVCYSLPLRLKAKQMISTELKTMFWVMAELYLVVVDHLVVNLASAFDWTEHYSSLAFLGLNEKNNCFVFFSINFTHSVVDGTSDNVVVVIVAVEACRH